MANIKIDVTKTRIFFGISQVKSKSEIHSSGNFLLFVKSISWRLAEFHYNRGLWRPHTCTCIIIKEIINRVLCPLVVFLKSKAYKLNLKDVI